MRTKNTMLYATLLLVAMLLGSCSSAEDEIAEEPQTLGDVVRAQFSISIPMSTQDGLTRQSDAVVQSTEAISQFRGINEIKIFPSAVLPADFTTSTLLGKDISLSRLLLPSAQGVNNYIPSEQLLTTSRSVLYGDVQLQMGTRTFLFYGKAIGKSEIEETSEYTAADFFKYGHLDVTGLSDDDAPANVAGFRFSPKPITTATKSDAMRAAIVNYLNSIANAEATDGEKWSTTSNTGLSNLFTAFTGMKAGSLASIEAALKDLYFALADNNYLLPKAICAAIEAGPVTVNKTLRTLTFDGSIANYPGETDFLPDGAAVLNYSGSTFRYVENTALYSSMNIPSIVHYVYPANLYYWCKSGLVATESAMQSSLTPSLTWDEVKAAYNGAENSSVSITSKTRSVIFEEPVQYAVGRLDISVTKLYTSETYLKDQNGNDVNPNDILLTGVLIGGQKNVGWDFQPVTGAEYTIYDNVLLSQGRTTGLPLSTNLEDYINSTLVLETAGGTDANPEKVNVALEFVNNGADFTSKYGIIPSGTKFYLVGSLDVSTVTADMKNRTGGKVFKQDYVTQAQFRIQSLKSAENTIPDLRNPAVEIGLSVDLKWKEGITFSHTFN